MTAKTTIRQNESTYGGIPYLNGVVTALLKRIGLLDHNVLTIRCEASSLPLEAETVLTKTWHCYSHNKGISLPIYFDIFQSQFTQANTVYLTELMVDVMLSFLSNTTLEDFDDNFHFINGNYRPMNEDIAAEELYRAMSFRLTAECEKLVGIPFDVLDRLTLTRYEGVESKGKLAFAFCIDSSELVQQCDWTLQEPATANVEHVRLLRKLLEGTGKDCALAFFKDTCVGMISEKKTRDLCPVIVELDGPMNWKFRCQGTVLFQRTHNGYQIDKSDNQINLRNTIESVFGIHGFDNSRLKHTLDRIKSKHGTAVIIADFNNNKSPHTVERFKTLSENRTAMAVSFDSGMYLDYDEKEKIEAAVEIFSSAASMDGAVVMDLQGHIRYLAAILDAHSNTVGNIARGSRFNSVNNFVIEMKKYGDQVMGIVLSEDGGADIIDGKDEKETKTTKNSL